MPKSFLSEKQRQQFIKLREELGANGPAIAAFEQAHPSLKGKLTNHYVQNVWYRHGLKVNKSLARQNAAKPTEQTFEVDAPAPRMSGNIREEFRLLVEEQHEMGLPWKEAYKRVRSMEKFNGIAVPKFLSFYQTMRKKEFGAEATNGMFMVRVNGPGVTLAVEVDKQKIARVLSIVFVNQQGD